MIQTVQQDLEVLKKGGQALTLAYEAAGASPTTPNLTPNDEMPVIAEILTAVTDGDIETLDLIISRYAS